jgi:aryl-alcohol dehydrogenase-like predicted oxidoreductase
MKKRPYGDEGDKLSLVALGAIVIKNLPQQEANAIVAEAFDSGVNYIDVAPTYGDPEVLLGPALDPFPREEYFLACKTARRDAKGAREELERSLERLHTDYLDLYQLHNCSSDEDLATTLGPGGALETFVEAKDQGLIRHIGFSTHREQAGLQLLDAYAFDSALFPVNWVCMLKGTFGQDLLDRCKQQGVNALALKAMARTEWDKEQHPEYPNSWYRPETRPEISALALRFTLGLGVTAAVPPGDPGLWRRAVKVAQNYEPLGPAELAKLKEAAQEIEPLFQKG